MVISNLRPGQKEAADYRGGYLAVPAVPGAGKTSVLAYLGAELLSSSAVGSGKLLVVTYLNSSVASFRKKIKQELEARGKSNLGHKFEVRTIHSLAAKIVRERPDILQVSDEVPVVDGDWSTRLIRQLLRQWLSDTDNWEAWVSVVQEKYRKNKYTGRNWFNNTVNLMEQAVKYFKAHKLRHDYLQHYLVSLPAESYLRWAIEIYGIYESELKQRGLCDFDDLILFALDLMNTDSDLLERLRSRWTYIFEDEAQDSTPLQEEMLLLLAGENGNIVRVGDTNQSISSTFTAADPELFKKFCAEMKKQGKVQPLSYSSRSTPEIINIANTLVDWVRIEHPDSQCKEALAGQHISAVPHGVPGPGNPENPSIAGALIARHNNPDREQKDVCARVKEYLEREKEGKAAILTRNNFTIDKIVEELENMGVPYRVINSGAREVKNTLRALCACVDFIVNPHDGDRLNSALKLALVPGLKEAQELVEFLSNSKVEQLIYPQPGEPLERVVPGEILAHELWPDILSALEEVRKWLGASRLPPESLVMYLAEELGLEGDDMAMAQRLAQEFQVRAGRDPRARLVDLVEEVKKNDRAFNYFIKVLNDRAGFEPGPGEVTLSTCHSAKGLEWDAVFAVGMSNINFPTTMQDPVKVEKNYLKEDAVNPEAMIKAELEALENGYTFDNEKAREIAKAAAVNEHLRLLYVTITRAEKYLRLIFGTRENYICKALYSLHNKGVLKYHEPAGR
ncbi:MAG: ATP-dependent helicase [Clostridiales bacterium]|nr:ATP-dependent helicase [Clostridiales bacterium]